MKHATMPSSNPPLHVLPDALQPARAALQSSRHARAQIAHALNQARDAYRATEGEHQAAVERLAASESDAAVGIDSMPSTAIVDPRRVFTATRDSVDFAHARVLGLETKLTIADEQIADAERTLRAAWNEWVRGQLDTLKAEYHNAANDFLRVVDRGLAIASAFSDSRTLLSLGRVVIPEAANVRSVVSRSGGWRNEWRKDPQAAALYASLLAIRQHALGESSIVEPTEAVGEPPLGEMDVVEFS